jgi:xylulokinase
MPLVAGVDSSTQSCKVVILDLETGALVRHGRAPHPDSTEVHPDIWWSALSQAIEAAGGTHDVSGIAVAAQQHGMICCHILKRHLTLRGWVPAASFAG